ncbi:MAG: OmpA family protein [Bacteroidales bacterium]|nr:OmpA family protein [Bacteroidales bacterium]
MKKLFTALLVCALILPAWPLMAQNGGKKTTKTSTSTSSKKKKNAKTKPEPVVVQLPAQSNDCIFAIDLQPDIAYGPTNAPAGAGRVQDIMRDKNTPNVFEYEHNSVWFKLTIPYSGDLEFDLTQTNPKDDYDFLVYRYTDAYFSNHLIQNKIKPIASSLAAPDTAFNGKGVTQGMRTSARELHLSKRSTERFVKSIPVKKGEVYYIVLDNLSPKGEGFTLRASVKVDFFSPTVMFYDAVQRKYVDVDLLILEKSTDNRPIVKDEHFRNSKVRFVPNFNYALYAKHDGYFSIYKEFNSNIFKEDTLMRFIMNHVKVGTVFPISEIYFDDEGNLLPESDTVLLDQVAVMKNHPNVEFKIKGYVFSYGIDIDGDLELSLQRAQRVKSFFVDHGINAARMTVAGMTINEIKRTAAAALNKTKPYKDAKVELIITSVGNKK